MKLWFWMVMVISNVYNVAAPVYYNSCFTISTMVRRTLPVDIIFCRAVTVVGVAVIQY